MRAHAYVQCSSSPHPTPPSAAVAALQEDDFAKSDVRMELMETDSDSDHQLPLVYDVPAISAYWGRRPVSVITRVAQLLGGDHTGGGARGGLRAWRVQAGPMLSAASFGVTQSGGLARPLKSHNAADGRRPAGLIRCWPDRMLARCVRVRPRLPARPFRHLWQVHLGPAGGRCDGHAAPE